MCLQICHLHKSLPTECAQLVASRMFWPASCSPTCVCSVSSGTSWHSSGAKLNMTSAVIKDSCAIYDAAEIRSWPLPEDLHTDSESEDAASIKVPRQFQRTSRPGYVPARLFFIMGLVCSVSCIAIMPTHALKACIMDTHCTLELFAGILHGQ